MACVHVGGMTGTAVGVRKQHEVRVRLEQLLPDVRARSGFLRARVRHAWHGEESCLPAVGKGPAGQIPQAGGRKQHEVRVRLEQLLPDVTLSTDARILRLDARHPGTLIPAPHSRGMFSLPLRGPSALKVANSSLLLRFLFQSCRLGFIQPVSCSCFAGRFPRLDARRYGAGAVSSCEWYRDVVPKSW